jgi:hypothetical protein
MQSPSPPHWSTAAIPALALGGGLYLPANQPAGPTILVPIAWEVSSQVPYGSQVTEYGECTAKVDHPFNARRIIASAPGHAAGRNGDLLDDFNAFLPHDWIFGNATNSATSLGNSLTGVAAGALS